MNTAAKGGCPALSLKYVDEFSVAGLMWDGYIYVSASVAHVADAYVVVLQQIRSAGSEVWASSHRGTHACLEREI